MLSDDYKIPLIYNNKYCNILIYHPNVVMDVLFSFRFDILFTLVSSSDFKTGKKRIIIYNSTDLRETGRH